ncbi:Rv3235 family protein [Antrihabitans cavernicola]|uniref:Uncharacterized protein n=1 Tax=Antrihabitans cavernicola TaxID=2495913 RepID=A0A5A7SEX6_9NOCA|nr:Rv3235 family protein [Spelaeibacter cavernicola]KAA0023989.1 hypothetical protein FOY51_05270 [Spelaeibacter cavernicola]
MTPFPSRPPQFLSRPPQCEPALYEHGRVGTRHCAVPQQRTVRRTPHDGRSGSAPAVPIEDLENHTAARRFTEHALRLVLEVVDRRRPPTQLKSIVEPALLEMVRARSLTAFPGKALGTGTLERVHIRLVDPTTAEVFGTYSRGPRMFAVAARITNRTGIGWSVTSLRFG